MYKLKSYSKFTTSDSPPSTELLIEPEDLEYDNRDVLQALLGDRVSKMVRGVVSKDGGMQIFMDAAM